MELLFGVAYSVTGEMGYLELDVEGPPLGKGGSASVYEGIYDGQTVVVK